MHGGSPRLQRVRRTTIDEGAPERRRESTPVISLAEGPALAPVRAAGQGLCLLSTTAAFCPPSEPVNANT